MDLNRRVLAGLAPSLLAVGVAGFVVPEERAMTSGATPYNVFHLVAGAVGLACLVSGRPGAARAFNLTFGAIDLYQAAASKAGWPPAASFRWKRGDDVAHVAIGGALVAVGLLGSGTDATR